MGAVTDYVVCGNALDSDALELLGLWEEKASTFPQDIVASVRRLCIAGFVWRQSPCEPAIRARGVVWIIGLTHVGIKLLAALRTGDSDGKAAIAALVDHGCSALPS